MTECTWLGARTHKPALRQGWLGSMRSDNVLLVIEYDKRSTIMVGYLERWDDSAPEWKLEGRDGYTAGNVTYWAELPSLPEGTQP